MSFFGNLFGSKKKSDTDTDIKDIEIVKKKYVDNINYWAGIIGGTKKLIDGSTFDSFTVFNTKHLEYSKNQIQLALIQRGINSKDRKDFEATKVCYIYTANFNNTVKDKYVSKTQKITDLVTKYGNLDSLSRKDKDKLIKETAEVPNDEKEYKEFLDFLHEDQVRYTKFFEEIYTKSKK